MNRKDYKKIFYPESQFGGFTDVDGTITFYTRISALIESTSVVLDFGCGRGSYSDDRVPLRRDLRIFKGRCEKVIGIDVDEAAKHNNWIDEFHLLRNDHWPLADRSVDICICDNVLEHVERPELFFAECGRVIKPAGFLCIRTPNILNYAGLISRIVPNRFHSAVLKKIGNERKEEDVFPTFYRCNTLWKMKKILSKYDFDHCVYGYEAEPSYLSFSRFFYFLGVVHQRIAPPFFRSSIFAFARKGNRAFQ